MAERLDVTIGADQVGALEREASGALRFAYDEIWLERPDATPLSVSMPLRPGPFAHEIIHPYLWGLLPDSEAVIDRWARRYQCSPSNVFALLSNVGADVAGAAVYLPPGGQSEEADEGGHQELTEAEVAELLREVTDDAAAWHPRDADGRWSLAGAQAKIALAYDPVRGWSRPHGREPTTHILKPAIERLIDQDLDELLCVRVAAALGLVAEDVDLGRFGEQRALVVKRYDRVPDPAGEIVRVHQEDLCQALGVHPNRKYQNEGGPSVEDMVSVLREHSTAPSADVDRLIDAVAYNWLILGTDAHAKNYSLLLSGQQVRLAPLYDVASLAPYVDHAPKAKLAQKIGGEYRAGTIRDEHWARLAKAVGLDEGALLGRITDLAERIPHAFDEAIAAVELGDDERAAATDLASKITAWTAVAVEQLGSRSRTAAAAPPPDRSQRPPLRHPRGTPNGGRFAPASGDDAGPGLEQLR